MGGHSCKGCPLPRFHLTPHLPAAIGATAHAAQAAGATSVPRAFVPSVRLFLYMHFKNSSPRLP